MPLLEPDFAELLLLISCFSRKSKIDVTIFEKSRGLGGRMSTRRTHDHGKFDHGAQYFTVRDLRFEDALKHYKKLEIVQKWDTSFMRINSQRIEPLRQQPVRWVACPGMNRLVKEIAKNSSVELQTKIDCLHNDGSNWYLNSDDGRTFGAFDAIVMTAPPVQTLNLLDLHAPGLSKNLAKVQMLPCWTLMIQFKNSLGAEFGGAFIEDCALSWIACDSSKPGRSTDRSDNQTENWVVHGSSDWSAANLENAAEVVQADLYQHFCKIMKTHGFTLPEPTFSIAHRVALLTIAIPSRRRLPGRSHSWTLCRWRLVCRESG